MKTKITNEQISAILHGIESGLGLRTICRDMGIEEAGFRRLVTNDHEGLASRYAHAREIRADVIAEEIIDIADTAEDANIARLQIDARKWYAGKVRPKVYGDKTTTALEGADGGPVTFVLGVPRLPGDPVNE